VLIIANDLLIELRDEVISMMEGKETKANIKFLLLKMRKNTRKI
jgi:hypothetical protein